jgi:hypothetical protein
LLADFSPPVNRAFSRCRQATNYFVGQIIVTLARCRVKVAVLAPTHVWSYQARSASKSITSPKLTEKYFGLMKYFACQRVSFRGNKG